MVRIVISDLEEIIDQAIAEIAAYVNKSRRALVITGAGISCSSGIPDFRSTDGLYNLIKRRHPNVTLTGAELFDAMLFRDADRTRSFYMFIAELKSLVRSAKPTATHNFIRRLQTDGRLLRLYTQNIDDLETALDLPVVQLHGTLGHVKCMLCAASFQFTREFQSKFRKGEAPSCPNCVATGEQRVLLGKRPLAVGVLRPNIVLYNEDHPEGDKIGLQQLSDIKRNPDMLIVVGTSLKIPALKNFVKLAARTVRTHRHGITVLINKTAPTKEWDHVFDYQIVGDADDWVRLTESKLRDHEAIASAWARIQQKKRRRRKDAAATAANATTATTSTTAVVGADSVDRQGSDEDQNASKMKKRMKKSNESSSKMHTAARISGQTTLNIYKVTKRKSPLPTACHPKTSAQKCKT